MAPGNTVICYDKLLNRNDLTGKFDREFADSVLEVSIRANKQVVGELRGDDGEMCQALLEIMEPEIKEIVGAAVKDRAIETVVKMIKSGKFSAEEIHEYVPGLSIEEIRMLERK